MSASPKAVIGMLTLNRAEYLPEALESVLAQTYQDLKIVVVDDGSTDETMKVLAGYEAIDGRVAVHRNETRLGTIRNWRKAFDLAVRLYPGFQYFAWASDHDVWHPRWLSALVGELEQDPEIVLAYPMSYRISETGQVTRGPWSFDTRGVSHRRERLRRACWGMRAGDMVYGLFRADALARAGVFRPVLLPDRLLLAELSLLGEFRQVPEVLWHRRFEGMMSLRRQRANFFPEGPPLYSHLPWWLVHTAVLGRDTALRGAVVPGISLGAAFLLVWTHVLSSAKVEARGWFRRGRRVLLSIAKGLTRPNLR